MASMKPATTKRRVGCVSRVSTAMQAENDEGSLKTQAQRMRQLVNYKSETLGEDWEVVDDYNMQVASGKTSLGSAESQRLLEDIRAG